MSSSASSPSSSAPSSPRKRGSISSSNGRVARRRSSTSSTSASSSCSSKRTFVKHNYHDHYYDPIYRPSQQPEEDSEGRRQRRGPRGGVVTPFPERLYNMLSGVQADGFEDVVSWQPHGRCFVVHDPKRFVDEVMPKYFRQSKLTSFQRQVNLYGFRRLTNNGADRGGYYHELFLRGRPDLHKRLVRIRVKGNGTKSAASPATEPDFYKMTPCMENNHASAAAGNSQTYASSMMAVPAPAAVPAKPEAPAALLQQTMLGTNSAFKPLSRPQLVDNSPVLKPMEAPTSCVSLDEIQHKTMDHEVSSSFMDSWGFRMETPPPLTNALSLKCFARDIVRGQQQELCPVTPDAYTSQLYSMPLEQEATPEQEEEEHKMMVSPSQSVSSSPCATPVSPFDTDFFEDLSAPLEASGPYDNQKYSMDSFQQEIQALIQDVEIDFDDGIPTLDSVNVKTDDSFDPLLLLDEVSCPTQFY